MKSFYKLTLLLLLTALTTQARSQAFFGVYGGMNTAGLQLDNWKTNTDPADTKPTLESIRRLTFGVTGEIPLSRYFYLQAELAWTTKGGIINIDSGYSDILGGGNVTYKTVNNLDLHYLQLPILAKVRFQLTNPQPLYPNEGSGRPLFFEFYAGPVINFLAMPRANYSQTIHEQNALTNIDTTYKVVYSGATQGGLKKLDFSVALGGNFKWKVSRKTYIYLDARYSLNFMNINKSALKNEYLNPEGATVTSYPTLKNAGNLAITIGITTTFTKRRYWNHPRVKNRRF